MVVSTERNRNPKSARQKPPLELGPTHQGVETLGVGVESLGRAAYKITRLNVEEASVIRQNVLRTDLNETLRPRSEGPAIAASKPKEVLAWRRSLLGNQLRNHMDGLGRSMSPSDLLSAFTSKRL
jgi:hypothetical protein